jgi:predicted TIM-barrel fold metal-dependent hydrolase
MSPPVIRTNHAGPRRRASDPGFVLPPGACDTHVHILGPYDRHPLLVTRMIEPPAAPLEDYLATARPLGLARAVIVQPSVYASDNRCTLEAIAALGPAARGVAVIGPEVSDEALAALHRGGVRGVRLQAVAAGGQSPDLYAAVARRIAPLGWHLQLFLDARALPPILPLLRGLGLPLVFDHMAQIDSASGEDEPGFQALLTLLAEGLAWVKLSNSFFVPRAERARALFAANPRRCVWGSDWPHMAEMEPAVPDEGQLLARLAAWFPDPAARQAILAENPDALYFR